MSKNKQVANQVKLYGRSQRTRIKQDQHENNDGNTKIDKRKDEATHDRSRHKFGTKKAKGKA